MHAYYYCTFYYNDDCENKQNYKNIIIITITIIIINIIIIKWMIFSDIMAWEKDQPLVVKDMYMMMLMTHTHTHTERERERERESFSRQLIFCMQWIKWYRLYFISVIQTDGSESMG